MADVDTRSAEARLIAEARKAFFVMFSFLCLVWAIQLGNWSDGNALTHRFGIVPQDASRLPDLLTAPFLHVNWAHLESNSGPLFVFGFLAAYRGVKKFLGLTLLIAVTSGLTVWIFQASDTLTVGASGLVFGYFGYVVLRGIFDRRLIDTLIGVVMAASFAYLVSGAVPGAPGGVSWLAHLGGLAGGLSGAWIFRDRAQRTQRTHPEQPAKQAKLPGQDTSPHSELLKQLDDLDL